MGRVIEKQIVAFRCEIRSCGEEYALFPALPVSPLWEDHVLDVLKIIQAGWGVVLTPQMRTYCPEHAKNTFDCTCRTNPARRHLCVQHDAETAELAWVSGGMPKVVSTELERGILL